MPPKRGAPPRPGPTTDRGNPAADLLQIATSLIIHAIVDCNFAAREDHLAPRAGEVGRRAQRGIRMRGKWPRAVAAVRSRADPSPQPSPRKRGEGVLVYLGCGSAHLSGTGP